MEIIITAGSLIFNIILVNSTLKWLEEIDMIDPSVNGLALTLYFDGYYEGEVFFLQYSGGACWRIGVRQLRGRPDFKQTAVEIWKKRCYNANAYESRKMRKLKVKSQIIIDKKR